MKLIYKTIGVIIYIIGELTPFERASKKLMFTACQLFNKADE